MQRAQLCGAVHARQRRRGSKSDVQHTGASNLSRRPRRCSDRLAIRRAPTRLASLLELQRLGGRETKGGRLRKSDVAPACGTQLSPPAGAGAGHGQPPRDGVLLGRSHQLRTPPALLLPCHGQPPRDGALSASPPPPSRSSPSSGRNSPPRGRRASGWTATIARCGRP